MTLIEILARYEQPLLIVFFVGVAFGVLVVLWSTLIWARRLRQSRLISAAEWRLTEAGGSVVGIDQHRRPRLASLRRMQPSWLGRKRPVYSERELLGKIGAPGLQKGGRS